MAFSELGKLAICVTASMSLAGTALAETTQSQAITADKVERLCPVTGSPGLALGDPSDHQPTELKRGLRQLSADLAPFTKGRLELTPWSERVTAVTYSAEPGDTDQHGELLEAFDAMMIAAGWQPVTVDNEKMLPLNILDQRAYRREVMAKNGPQTLLVEFATDGAVQMRCGDPALLELAQREREGRLDPGSPRPIAPPFDPARRVPDAKICKTARLQEFALAKSGLDEFSPDIYEFGSAAFESRRRAGHGKRLNTWLEWKLLGSGRVSEDRLFELQEPFAKLREIGLGKMMQMLVPVTAFANAREQGNGEAACEAMRQVLVAETKQSLADIAYWDKVNAALEAEAKRAGAALEN